MFSLQHLGIKTIWAARLINGAFREIGTYEQITGAMPLRDGAKAFRAAVKSMVNVQDGLFIPVIRTSDSAMMRRRQKAWAQVDQCEYRRGRLAIKHLQSRKGSAPGIGRPDHLPPFACLGLHQFRAEFISGKRSEEHTSELQSLMRISYAVFCLKKKNKI